MHIKRRSLHNVLSNQPLYLSSLSGGTHTVPLQPHLMMMLFQCGCWCRLLELIAGSNNRFKREHQTASILIAKTCFYMYILAKKGCRIINTTKLFNENKRKVAMRHNTKYRKRSKGNAKAFYHFVFASVLCIDIPVASSSSYICLHCERFLSKRKKAHQFRQNVDEKM